MVTAGERCGSDMQNMVLDRDIVTVKSARDIMDTTRQALEHRAWVGPTWQNHPAMRSNAYFCTEIFFF